MPSRDRVPSDSGMTSYLPFDLMEVIHVSSHLMLRQWEVKVKEEDDSTKWHISCNNMPTIEVLGEVHVAIVGEGHAWSVEPADQDDKKVFV